MQPNSGPILALNPTYASPAPTHNQAMLPELNEYHGGDKAELAWSALNAQQHPLYSPTSTSTEHPTYDSLIYYSLHSLYNPVRHVESTAEQHRVAPNGWKQISAAEDGSSHGSLVPPSTSSI